MKKGYNEKGYNENRVLLVPLQLIKCSVGGMQYLPTSADHIIFPLHLGFSAT